MMFKMRPTSHRTIALTLCCGAAVLLLSVQSTFAISESVQNLEQRLQGLLAEKRQHASDPDILVKLADVYLDLGDEESQDTAKRRAAYEEGARLARQALDLQEQNADAHYLYAANLGSAAQLRGSMASALTVQDLKTHVRRALELNGNHAPALHMMGMMMEELPWFLGGDTDAALTYLKRALLADPSYIHARLDLAKIYIKRHASDEARRELRIIVEGPQPADLSAGARRYREEAWTILNSLNAHR
jgi:tetratricopeptide (TPR) repeat protein